MKQYVDKCGVCRADLSACDTIFAAEGSLYCSRDCGIHDFENKYGSAAERHFDDVSEEIQPMDAGIQHYMNREQILCALHELAKSQGFYQRFLYNIENDKDGAEAVLHVLESQKFKDTVDLVLFLEGL